MPEHEDDHLTPATRLLEKRREMAEVEQALAAQKEVCQLHWCCLSAAVHLFLFFIHVMELKFCTNTSETIKLVCLYVCDAYSEVGLFCHCNDYQNNYVKKLQEMICI